MHDACKAIAKTLFHFAKIYSNRSAGTMPYSWTDIYLVLEGQYEADYAKWLLANSTKEKQALILELYTDTRIVPYKLQYVLGLEEWTPQMFRRLGTINPHNFTEIDGIWGVYDIEVKVPRSDGRSIFHRYTGSCVGGYGNRGIIGLSSRIVNGYETLIALGLDEILTVSVGSVQRKSHVYTSTSYVPRQAPPTPTTGERHIQ